MRLVFSLYRHEYRNFKLAGATMGSKRGRSEEDWTGRCESIGAVIDICMGTTQGNSCVTVFISN
jgi:hypothetical protein